MASFFLVATNVCLARGNLDVLAAEPAPNYPLTTDEDDLKQLTDGLLARYKSWTKKDSVGWVRRTPVRLDVVISAAPVEDAEPVLMIRTGKSVSSGVFPPRRVDVYCNFPGETGWLTGGGYQQDTDQHADSQNVWLEIPLDSRCRDELRLVVHADGSFLMLDEIDIRYTDALATTAHGDAHPAYAESELVSSSLDGLRAVFARRHAGRIERLLDDLGFDGLNAWLLPAFHRLAIGDPQFTEQPAILTTQYVPTGGDAAAVLAIANGGKDERQYSLSLESAQIAEDYAVFQIKPLLAFDGGMVYDALIPVTDMSALTIGPRSLEFFYLDFESVQQSGEAVVSVLDKAGVINRMGVPIKSIGDLQSNNSNRPWLFTWSYSSDKPIWSSLGEAATVDYLTDAGVNVFIVHPKFLPLPNQHEKWPDLTPAFADEVSLYKDRGIILFFLAWDVKLAGWEASETNKAQAIDKWLAALVSRMEQLGFSYDDWALYPVDEPHGNKLSALTEFARHIDAADNRVQVYANPIREKRDLLLTARLRKLLPYIDIWQPRAGKMAQLLSELVPASGDARFWIYDNPREPAKSAAPACYRALAWQAFEADATGFAFWSFSDTGGSSAWDDFDGSRSDWAVVYESAGELVSSRRWEAAKFGVQDFSLARTCIFAAIQPASDQTISTCKTFLEALRVSAEKAGCDDDSRP